MINPPSLRDTPLDRGATAQFLYYGMRKSVTGAKNALDPELQINLQNLKKYIHTPIAVGWGISTPKHIQSLPREVDIAIVGSQTLDVYNARFSLEDVRDYIGEMV